jgi:hypothetical protein
MAIQQLTALLLVLLAALRGVQGVGRVIFKMKNQHKLTWA